MLRRRKPVSVFDGVPLREETVEAGDIAIGVDWMGACDRYEKALQRAQEGFWTEALELRDAARAMLT